MYRCLEPFLVEFTIANVSGEVDRTQIADGGLLSGGVEKDFRAEITAVHNACMGLRRANIRGIFPGDPGMASFKESGEHLAPEFKGGYAPVVVQLALIGQAFILVVALCKSLSIQVVQIAGLIGAKEGPLLILLDALHKQVRDPAGG